MQTDPQVLTVTCRTDLDVDDTDTLMVTLPDFLYDNPNLINATLHGLSDKAAAQIGAWLHHAEWVITRDPEVVRRRATVTGELCVRCTAMLDQALAFLREHPETDLMIGTLYLSRAR